MVNIGERMSDEDGAVGTVHCNVAADEAGGCGGFSGLIHAMVAASRSGVTYGGIRT